MIKYYLLVSIFFVCPAATHLQTDTLYLSFEKAIELALQNAVELKLAQSQLKENAHNQKLFYLGLQPNLSFNGTAPNLSRSIEARPLPDGRDAFVNRSTMYNGLGVSLSHQIPSLNASWYARTDLERLDVFKTDQFAGSTTYFFTPISVGINIPLFRFNEIKWGKQQFQLLDDEMIAEQAVIRESVINRTLNLYSVCFQLQKQLEVIERQIEDVQILFGIKKKLNELGSVPKAEILRLELQLQNNESSFQQRLVDFNNAKMKLFDYINLRTTKDIFFVNPDWEPISVDFFTAIQQATQNKYILSNHILRRQTLEAELLKTKKENGVNLNLNASVGLNKTDENLQDLYRDLLDREVIALTLQVPITGWKAQLHREEIVSEKIYREDLIMQEEITDIKRDLKILFDEYNSLVDRIIIEKEAVEITAEIYELTRTQFLAGNENFNQLNIVNKERDQAFISYFNTVFDTIVKYFEIREVCLYDFVGNKTLVKDQY
ncbi:MAG: TolC family protein [Bacteroidota bacterium]